MPWWSDGLLALCMVSLGIAMLVDPANFAPSIIGRQALKRRRIFGASGFLLMACLSGAFAYQDYIFSLSHALEKGWPTDLAFGCRVTIPIMFAVPAIHVWFQIASRARARRRTDRPGSASD